MFEYAENNTLCIEVSWLTDEGIMTMANYKSLLNRNKINRMQRGGNGRKALVEYSSIPGRYKKVIEETIGYNPTNQAKHQFFRKHIVVDRDAVTFFSNYQTQDGKPLPIERQKEYTINAMMLNAIQEVVNKTTARRKAMGGRTTGIWDNMADVVNDLRDEKQHTLPGNPVRLREKLRAYLKEGYTELIHRGYGNNNSRKVNAALERLILSIYVMNNKPYPVMVRDIYMEFLAGKVDIIDSETGELFQREEFYNEKGLPLVISEATIFNYVNDPKNRAIVDSVRNDFHYYNNIHRPHHHRARPNFSLSKISLDDRDLIGKVVVGGHKQRVKAYYAYDVASGALIGASYSYNKDKDLFLECMRDMFRFLKRHDLGFPLEPEVEHHIVSKFSNDLMKAGNVFPLIRWCAPGNSQEKRAEHFNRQKKYGFEKRYNDGVGRFTLSEANRPKQDKVWDDDGMHLKETIYEFDELVANDRYTIQKYNHSLHPDQKKYKGLTRMQVLLQNVNPQCVAFNDPTVAQYAGEKTDTSIRRNQYVRVNYEDYQLPSVDVLTQLDPNDYKVEAYYLKADDGSIEQVHLFQGGEFICTCDRLTKYNEATAEQTDEDRLAMVEQSKYVSSFDGMIREGRKNKTAKLKIMPVDAEPDDEPVILPRIEETTCIDDYDDINEQDWAGKAWEDL